MKKQILILIGLCLLGTQVNAQVAIATAKELSMISRGVAESVRKGNPLYIPGKARVGRTGLYSFQVTHVLRRRAAKAQRRALKMQKILPGNKKTISVAVPVANLRNGNATIEPLLQTTLTRTPKQIDLYLTARENRMFAQEVYRMYLEVWAKLLENLPHLRQAADQTPTPADPLGFLAQTIPAEVNTIAIGEIHGFKNIRLCIAQFLTELRKVRPNQEIFIFTEAVQQETEFLHTDGEHSVLPKGGRFGLGEVWQAARDNHIPIIGLEPPNVLQSFEQNKYPFFNPADPKGEYRLPFFASLSGVKWRNEMFLKTIQKYRVQHPDALFIVHTGSGHVQYTAPFSITAQLEAQKTFVLCILPTREQALGKTPARPPQSRRFMWDPLGNELNGIESFDQPFLYWQDPQLARITGADAFIQTEEKFLNP